MALRECDGQSDAENMDTRVLTGKSNDGSCQTIFILSLSLPNVAVAQGLEVSPRKV